MTPHPKMLPARSNRYRKFIRSKPCLFCGSRVNVHAAHQAFGFGGMATKSSDLWTLPACAECHIDGEHRYGEKTFWEGYDLKLECLKLINEFFSLGGKL